MADDPLRNLVGDLGRRLTKREHSDRVLKFEKGKVYELVPSEFNGIRPAPVSRKIAFIDGGDGLLDEAPNYLITINRVSYSLFRGKKRIMPAMNHRIQFFSYVVSDIQTRAGQKKLSYNTKLFAYGREDKVHLPDESDLTSSAEGTTVLQKHRLNSLARQFAEWRLALNVVKNELDEGDILVKDGSLQTGFKNEAKYAKELYQTAKNKGVIVCGLSKSSRLITESGDSLIPRIEAISKKTNHDRWYIRVTDGVTSDDCGAMLAVKLHPDSEFPYRFEILYEQFDKMKPDEVNSVLYNLVENSQDISMLGYPYGLIDADRYAQVRLDERDMYKGILYAIRRRNPEWKDLENNSSMMGAHNVLNEVTS